MTIRTNATQTCDRCLKPFNERNLKAGDEVPVFKQKGLVVTETTGTSRDTEPTFKVLFSFDDICPTCQSAVSSLLDRLRLDAKPKTGEPKKRNPKKSKTESTPEASTKPPEYTEDAPAGTPPAEASSTAAASEASAPEKPADPAPVSEKPADPAPAESGAAETASTEDPNVIVDPETGDRYDSRTGEVLSKGEKKSPVAKKRGAGKTSESKAEAKGEDHPF